VNTTTTSPVPDRPVTRRDFVAVAGLVTAAGIVMPRAALGAFSRGADTLRVGLVGCGGRGTGAAAQALHADPGTVLVAMGDVFDDRLQSSLSGLNEEMGDQASQRIQVPKERQFVGFDSYKKVIDSGVDVVLLCGYPAFRPEQLEYAINAGKHVFLEKPVAVDSPGIRSVLASAKKAQEKNLACMVGFCWRYHPGMRDGFAHVHGGGIGDVVTVYTNYHTSTLSKRPRKPEWSDLEFQMRNWWHFTWISGDHIVEQAIHSVDRLAWATGDKLPLRVVGLGGRAARSGPEHGNVFDHFTAIFEYQHGLRAIHTTRQIDGCPADNTDYIYGTKGHAQINGWQPTLLLKDFNGVQTWKGTGSPEDAGRMYQIEHDELFKSIRAGKPINDCERGANSTLMAIMAREAAYTGQTISWEQAMNSKAKLGPEKLDFAEKYEIPPVAIPGKTKFV
jgi:predicted dehydrogenase